MDKIDEITKIIIKEKGVIVMPSREAFEMVVKYTDNYNDHKLSVSRFSGIPVIWREDLHIDG